MNLKRLLCVVCISCFVISCSSSKNASDKSNTETSKYNWFPFSWYSAEVSGRHFDKVAILIPAKVNDLNAEFTLQFDLGSNATSIYGNTISSYYPEKEMESMMVKSSKSTTDAGKTTYKTTGLTFHLSKFSVNDMTYLENYGDTIFKDSLFTETAKHIGTLGANVFENRILIIDYPNQRMCVLDTLDKYWENKTTFVQAQSKRGRLHIPLSISDKTYWFLFDTGASLFPISTNKEIWDKIVSKNAKTDTIIVNSWGEKVSCYGRPINEKVYLGKRVLKSSYAWYDENVRLQEFNKTENIDGLTGNAYFLNDIVILDFKNKQFGIVD